MENADFKFSHRVNEPKSEALSSLMRKSWTSGQFWFNECSRAHNFDGIYWLRLHDLHYGPKESVESCVNDWAAIKMNGHIDGFIEEKLRDLKAYRQDLDALDETTVAETNGRAEHNDGKENERPQVVFHGVVEEQEQDQDQDVAVEMGKATLG